MEAWSSPAIWGKRSFGQTPTGFQSDPLPASSQSFSNSPAGAVLSRKGGTSVRTRSAGGKKAAAYFTLMLENMPPFFSTVAGEPETEIWPIPLTVALTASLA